MKSYNQFISESYSARENIQEALPALALLPLAGKALSYGLAAYSAYSAAKNLKKGNYGQAAWDALGAVPGGKAFQGARALGAGKNLSRAASATQSGLRWGGPTAVSKLETKVTDAALNRLTGAASAKENPATKQATKPQSSTTPTPKPTPTVTPKPASSTVLARKGGVMGKLNKATGKWTKGDWTQKESDRYKRVAAAMASNK